jgi:hypothetical protein
MNTTPQSPGLGIFDVGGLFVLTLGAVASVLGQQPGIDALVQRMLHTGVVGTLVLGLALLALARLTREESPVSTTGDSPMRAKDLDQYR